MPHAFVDITPELAEALESGLLLTSNDRLRRDLIRSYDIHQQRQGLRVWPTPKAFSLSGWWLHLYQRAADEEPGFPELLGRERAYLLLRELAPEGAANLSGTALAAWDLVQQWAIPLDAPGFGATEDSRLFASWARRFRDTLSERSQITTSQLADLPVLDNFIRDSTITCLEFESPTTQFQNWRSRVETSGTQLRMLYQPAHSASERTRFAFERLDDEINAAAAWSRALLENQSAQEHLRIGIVIPDLAVRHQSVLRRFAAQFSPLGNVAQAKPFDIGGGANLAEQPVWRVAREWLELCYRRISIRSLNQLYRSTYLTLPELPEELQETLEDTSLTALARAMGSKTLMELSSGISSGTKPLPAWLREFRILLNHAGWNAGAAGSLQFQAHQQLCHLLDELSADNAGEPLNSSEALDELLAAMSLRLFAPQRDPAPIQILGYLETTGLSFSHLWITGMDEDTWPSIGNTNPFLPVSLRREYGLPRSTPADELAFATDRLNHWQQCSDQLIISHAQQRGDRPVEPSPLITALAESVEFPLPVMPHPYFHTRTALEEIADDNGNPVPPGLLRGGSGLFTDQAGCPFRAWAIHRLGLREPRTPHAFPDPLDRGRLFHGVMQLLYEPHLHEIGPVAFTRPEIESAVSRSLESYYQRFPGTFTERERDRLLDVVDSWVTLESNRAPFTVDAVETSREVLLGDVRISLRLDRLDRVDNELVVIDYKTGRISLPSTEGFLIDPQLPIYAMTDERIAGVFYAQLDDSRARMLGIASPDVDLGKIRVAPAHQNSWSAQTGKWQDELLDLATEITSGNASVNPRRPGICDRCHLAELCRIDERRESFQDSL